MGKGERMMGEELGDTVHAWRFVHLALCFTQHVIRATCCVLRVACCAFLMTLSLSQPGAAAVDHTQWDTLLHRYVDQDGRVAYRDWQARDATAFDQYLKTLAQTQTEGMPEAEEKAFWINAYNAIIVNGVLHGYTAEGLLTRKRFFSWYSLTVAGKKRTPDEIEHQILRKKFHDPRIHFAIVCASTSCPKLRSEAYVPERLEQQLDDAAQKFINDPQRNSISVQGVALSHIFEWFAQDFIEQAGSVPKFLLRFVAAEKKAMVESLQGDFQYLEYDWTLNAQAGQRVS